MFIPIYRAIDILNLTLTRKSVLIAAHQTQSGKIAFVYYDSSEIKEYIDHIKYLQSKEILLEDSAQVGGKIWRTSMA